MEPEKTVHQTSPSQIVNLSPFVFAGLSAAGVIVLSIVTGKVRNEAVKQFISQIGSLPKDSADERITFDIVKIDDALAIAWTPYQFYYAGKFSHCGVNSFQLVRFNGVWKIQYLIDTRRRENCGPSRPSR